MASSPGITVAIEAFSGDDLLKKLRTTKVDLVLLDLNMPGRTGLDTIFHIKSIYPELLILILSAHYDVQIVLSAMRAGASGYISKNCSPQTLLGAIKEIIVKGKYLDQDMADRVADAPVSTQADNDGIENINNAIKLNGTAIKGWKEDFETVYQERVNRKKLNGELNSKNLLQENKVFDLHENELLKQALSIARIGSWGYDTTSGQLMWSDELYQIYGVSPETFTPSVENLITLIHPDDQAAMRAWIAAYASGQKTKTMEFRCMWPDGTIRYIEKQGNLKFDSKEKRNHLVGTAQDITERKLVEEEMRHLAFYDTLTNLPNRRLFNDRLTQTMATNKRSRRYGALMFIDLDNFKPLNDTYGHAVGDTLLIEAADRMKSCIREMDTVARFGGDEFVVMLSDLDADKDESTLQANKVAEKIRTSLSVPYRLSIQHDGQPKSTVEHHCTASIGVIVFISHIGSQDDILKWADDAMYQAKNAGRNQIRFYDKQV
ncbi:MAG: diguanylate cyclase [Methylococcaceae bacterium]|nr:diguanylate cyclase [Methylococcaceae bacterium]